MTAASWSKVGDVIDALVSHWSTLLGPDDVAVVDGPFHGNVGNVQLTVGVGNDADGDPYRVELSEPDPGGGYREDGVIRCQAAAANGGSLDPDAARTAVLAIVEAIHVDMRDSWPRLGGIVDDARLGSHRWWHLADAEAGQNVVAVDFELRWVAWL